MEKRIRFIHTLTVCAIIAFCIGQGYWLYSRYILSLDECEQELYSKVVAAAKQDIKIRESMIQPPRQTCSKLIVNYRQDSVGRHRELEWTLDVFLIDTTKVQLPLFPDSITSNAERYGTVLFDYLSAHYAGKQTEGILFHNFFIGKDDHHALGESMDAITRFYVNQWHPFETGRLDSILRAEGISPNSITVTTTDTMVWQPSYLKHTSLLRPEITVAFPFDTFGEQQAVVSAPVGISPVVQKMAYTLLATVLLSLFLVFCLVYQILTIRRQWLIEAVRKKFLRSTIRELKRKELFANRQEAATTRFVIGKTVFDSNLSTIEFGGKQRRLSARQTEILTILARNIGETVERDTILQAVWGDNSYSNSLALNVQITYIRRLLEPDSSVAIVSLKKRGYVLNVLG